MFPTLSIIEWNYNQLIMIIITIKPIVSVSSPIIIYRLMNWKVRPKKSKDAIKRGYDTPDKLW